MRTLLLTGGAGFIGSHLTEAALAAGYRVVVLDKLTYAGNRANLVAAERHPNCHFIQGDIADSTLIGVLLREYAIDAVLHLAAESHVDNSILGPALFVQTNVLGTLHLLEAVRAYLQERRPEHFRFINVSTDEVYGTLGESDPPFCETTAYAPNSPYAASKAGADHLVRAWHHTYGLPTLTTHCTNNYGPRQHAEKLIPTIVSAALAGMPLPIYGDGQNIRDWLYVGDHCAGILAALERGKPGDAYCFGGRQELSNLALVRLICATLDELHPRANGRPYAEQISFVADRPGHDRRYAVNDAFATATLGFQPQMAFTTGLRLTIAALALRWAEK